MTGPLQELYQALARYPALDPAAVAAVAGREGLGAGAGDQGTSFGDFQLHKGGMYPASAPQDPAAAQAWADSPAGLDYALGGINKVAGGLRGGAAVEAIVQRFERPANPQGEIAAADAAIGQPYTGAASSAPGGSDTVVPATDAAAADRQLAVLLMSTLHQHGPEGLLPLAHALAAARSARAGVAGPAGEAQPPERSTQSAARLAEVPPEISTKAGIQLDPSILGTVKNIAKTFGVVVNSGYRTAEHNQAVGGAENSDHLRGDAVDFTGSPTDMLALYRWAQGRFPYVEPWAEAGGTHVHISFRR